MTFNRLWAKSWDEVRGGQPPSHVFLPEHLDDVYEAANRLLGTTGDDQLRAVGLNPEEWRVRFSRAVTLAAAVHDLGKANDHFQGMISQNRDVRIEPQGVRHEWITLVMLELMRDWLLPAVDGSENDFAVVEWAVAGHHPSLHHASPPRESQPGAGVQITLLMDNEDFRLSLGNIRRRFSLRHAAPVLLNVVKPLCGTTSIFTEIGEWSRKAIRLWRGLEKTAYARFTAAVKDCVIAADVAGSALPKVMHPGRRTWDWITTSLGAKPQLGDLQCIVDHRLDGQHPRAFQNQIASSRAAITFAKAGCGTGKTLAAYMWAARNHPTRRLYFC